MIIFDANFLIALSDDGFDKSRLAALIASFPKKQVVGIPAPAWGEYICGAGAATSALTAALQSNSSVRILPFDEVAAVESAQVHSDIVRVSGAKKGSSTASWQKVKIDRQILAIARVHRATTIYTDDDNLIAEAALLGIPTCRLADLPRVPVQLALIPGATVEKPDTD